MISTQRPCICKICDCGRHKCPHKNECMGPWDPSTRSEYVNQYQLHEPCKPHTCKPPVSTVVNCDPLSNLTTNRVDYIAHDVQPPEKPQRQVYEPPEGLMDGQSVYRNEYNEKAPCAVRPIKPPHTMVNNGKFDGDTTHRCTYIPWDVCPPERRPNNKYEPPKEPFAAIPCYRADYIEHAPPKVHSCKPPVTCLNSNAPFANLSDYRQNYICHDVEARQQLNRQPYIKPEAPFEGITTNRQDYVAQDTCKPICCRPPPHRVCSDQPFCGQTTNRADYIAHDAQPSEKPEREKYIKPEGDMELRSTYNSDFISQPDSRVFPIKPPPTTVNNDPFDGTTSYRQNYQNWDQPANIVYKQEKYRPPEGKFDSDTTTRTDYIAHNIAKQPSCKPPIQNLAQEPFNGQTNYRADYIQRDLHPCPAENLTKNPRSVSPEGYLFDGEDCDGHIHYVKSYPMSGCTPDISQCAS